MRIWTLSAALAALCLPMRPALAQDTKDNVNPADIIQKFAAKEAEFRAARGDYTYTQTVKLEELDPPPTGMWYEVDDIIAARDRLKAEGARIIGSGEPKIGAHGKPVLFLHPKDFQGTLVELEQV